MVHLLLLYSSVSDFSKPALSSCCIPGKGKPYIQLHKTHLNIKIDGDYVCHFKNICHLSKTVITNNQNHYLALITNRTTVQCNSGTQPLRNAFSISN